MSFYGLADGTSVSSLFGSSSYSKQSTNTNILSEYQSIRSGSYYKLLKAYYNGNSKVDNLVSTNTATSKDSAKKLTAVENGAETLKEAADALYKQGSGSVFKETDIKQEDGTTTKGYDVDAIYKGVQSFVQGYNDLLDSAEDVSSTSVSRAVTNMKNTTTNNSKLLSQLGIEIKSNGSLTLDEKTFRAADMSKVKSLFNGTGSYGYQVSARASMVDYIAQQEASKSNTYNQYGSYSNNYNYSYNSYI